MPPDPDPGAIPRGEPEIVRPHLPGPREDGESPGALITWVGHATYLVQLPGVNLLTDPVWSRRASPLPWLGPTRFLPPGLAFEDLPPIDGVLLSHDHYDHLDRPTVERLRDRFGPDLRWLTPSGYGAWFTRQGVANVVELDWWEQVLGAPAPSSGITDLEYRLVCLPARHWTRRGWRSHTRLWSSWAVIPARSGASVADRGHPVPPSVLFVGDSAWFDGFARIGERLGPFGVSLLPIGAYEPRWFMAPAHMNPEEAVRAYMALGGRGAFVGAHWGTFRLTDEDPLEPPGRARRAWAEAGLPTEDLRLPGIGRTVRVAA